ncbi:hypothetical protein ACK8OR_10025 [Jannaschia sp. KMU-145]|uniref:hypothetical protein n=1 Tax=Jannaschia halovivens TaxID=3388667 RepID=UPI00396B47EA
MRHIYTARPRRRLLDRLALWSAVVLGATVTVDLLVYKDIAGFDRGSIDNVVQTSAAAD